MDHKWRQATERALQQAEQGKREQVILDIDAFMTSPAGDAAKKLLAATGRHIVIVESEASGGMGSVYALTGDGLVRSDEAMGMWVAHSTNVPKQNLSPATPGQIVEETLLYSVRKPEEIVPFIRSSLDAIADQVLED